MAGEKRSKDIEDSLLNENVIIVDIEGTTTSITFVKDTLFPYVRENVKKYIDAKWEDEEFKNDLEKLKQQAKKDEEDKVQGLVTISGTTDAEQKESIVKNVLWQMDGDRKTGALKQLQGHMWREAYNSGSIKGHVYEDVPECLKSWTSAGKKVYVYSSGSVEAQKLLFGHSERGDLLEYFTGYFDTEVGMKQEAASYKNILSQIKAEAKDVIFLTDIVKEAKAAKEAGLSSIIMIREGNAPLTEEEEKEGFRTAKSFLDLSFLNAAKRQKLDTPEVPKAEPAAEKMEIVSEDVEMTDVSDKDSKSNVESSDKKVEPEEANEKAESKDTGAEKAASETIAAKDEAMETDGKVEAVKKADENVSNKNSSFEKSENAKVEEVTESEKKEDAKTEEVAKAVDTEAKADGSKDEETIEKANTDETDKAVTAEIKRTEVLEKPVEQKPQTETVVATAVDEPMEEEAAVKTTETKSANKEVTDEKTETKTEETDNKSELSKAAKEAEKETDKKNDIEEKTVQDSCVKTVTEVKKSDDAKGESVAVDSEKVETSGKSEEAVTNSTDEIIVAKETVKENGTSKAETEIEDKKTNGEEEKKTETKVEETVVTAELKEPSEKKSLNETEKEPEVKNNKEAETKDTEAAKSGEEKDSDKDEGGAKTNSTSEEVPKDEEIKKVNGTTQNGDTATASDEKKKIHTNGVNEPCTSSDAADKNTSTDNNLAKNREPESSTDASAPESIKVKKVVDSTVAADGAGEPDVVPPAVVAATS